MSECACAQTDSEGRVKCFKYDIPHCLVSASSAITPCKRNHTPRCHNHEEVSIHVIQGEEGKK